MTPSCGLRPAVVPHWPPPVAPTSLFFRSGPIRRLSTGLSTGLSKGYPRAHDPRSHLCLGNGRHALGLAEDVIPIPYYYIPGQGGNLFPANVTRFRRVVLSGAPLWTFSLYMFSDNSTTHSPHLTSTYHTLFGPGVALGTSLVDLLLQSFFCDSSKKT